MFTLAFTQIDHRNDFTHIHKTLPIIFFPLKLHESMLGVG